ncbi:MAG: (d)CMP kinase [Candidatus Krumholzibacteriota bacterium]|nr:(d)CMP kinase [Candidatus Krumholzibacteriota bacterium]
MREDGNGIIRRMIITLDGPAGSGKSTTARLLAKRLGLVYLDTGAMYRAVTLALERRGGDPGDADAATAAARESTIEFRTVDGAPACHLDGENVEKAIRGPAVSRNVSPVSRHAGVRREMVRLQRAIGRRGGVVAEGRDTGSTVFPWAHLKVYLVADMDARASRRLNQNRYLGLDGDLDSVRENLASRDRIDSGREHSPLVQPAGAIVVDTSRVTIDEQVAMIEEEARMEAERLDALAVPSGKRNRNARMRVYFRLSQMLVRTIARVLFGLRIVGAENLRWREHYLFACNHISYADPPVVGCALDRETWFVAKKELFSNRLFAWLIRTYHAIEIDRDGFDRRALQRILELLASGESALMFPEGTRSRTGRLGTVKSGLGMIAIKSRVPVVPVYVTGTNALRACIARRRRLEVRIGPPVRIPPGWEPEDRKQAYATFARMVQEEIGMLRDDATA